MLNADAARRLQLRIEEDARSILIQRSIISPPVKGEDDIDFRVKLIYRKIPEMSGSEEPTLLIEAPWSEGSGPVWENAVRDLKRRINSILRQQGLSEFDVTVEMCAPELTRDKYIAPVVGQPAMEAVWPRILRGVRDKLETYPDLGPHITSVCLFRLGYSKNRAQNPITLYVSVAYDSNELLWPAPITALEKLLAEAGWGHVKVHMEHGEVQHQAFELNPPRDSVRSCLTLKRGVDYPERVGLGMDISAAKYFARAGDQLRSNSLMGTLGCYVQVKTKSNPQWTTFALTNHHVIRPAVPGFRVTKNSKSNETETAPPDANSRLAAADISGITPKQVSKWSCAPMESPSRAKHNHTIQNIKVAVEKNPSLQPHLDSKLSFFDSDRHILGEIWASSGFKKRSVGATDPSFNSWGDAERRRLDWALIKVKESRQGSNKLYSEAELEGAGVLSSYQPEPDGMKGNLKPPGPVPLGDMPGGTRVFKLGALTKFTLGQTSPFKAGINLDTDKYMKPPSSTEHLCVAISNGEPDPEKPFSLQGDSGSVVYDQFGRAVGLVVTGRVPHQGKAGYTVVTPIEDVFASILQHGEGNITDVRIAC